MYRQDLGFDPHSQRCAAHPNNVWSLHGLHECLVRGGKAAEAALIKCVRSLVRAGCAAVLFCGAVYKRRGGL